MRLPLTVSVISASLILAGSAAAEPFIPKINEPTSYKDVMYGLNEMRKNIDSVQCGGWTELSDASVSGTGVDGKVPIPRFTAKNPDGSDDTVALPGRDNKNPLGKPVGGLGERGDFKYPDSAFGFSSACDVVNTTVMYDLDLAAMGKDIKINADGSVDIVDGAGNIDINPKKWCVRNELLDNIMDGVTPTLCKRLFDSLWQMGPKLDAANARPQIGDSLCPVPKKFCFDFNTECRGQACRTLSPPSFTQTPPECHAETLADDTLVVVIDDPESISAVPASFYRHYAEDYMVPGITVTALGHDNTWNVRAECYEYYKEQNDDGTDFDPQADVSSKADEQCEFVIATEGEQNPKKPEWKPDDEGRSQKDTVKADRSVVQENPRDPRATSDPWVPDSDTNLTMIDMKKLKENQKNFGDPTDITAILGTLLTSRQTGSKTVPKNARTDQFDDTDERKMSAYFEAQQRELLKLTADPQTRLIMPARFLVGLAEDDPLFQYVRNVISRSNGTVEITLKAGLEDIGSVLKSFQRIFVAPIQEVRIPVLVPLASVTEIDARIADWKLWKKSTELQSLELKKTAETQTDPAKKSKILGQVAALNNAAVGAGPLVLKLEQYRNRTVSIRLMRGALALYLVRLYDSQKQIRGYFADWYQLNSTLLLKSAERAVQRRELKDIWRLLQQSMLAVDACQMLWCSNHRYSAPVYSLLDNWWGERQPGEKRDRNYQPQSLTDLNFNQPPDQLFDFSDVKFPSSPWLIPVLWPVQVRIRLPLPPLVGMAPPSPDEFPDLPALPDASAFNSFPVPSVDLPVKSLIIPPVSEDLEPAKDILRKFRKLIDGTEIQDQINEENALAAGQLIDNGDDNLLLDRSSMRSAYCRFPPSILIPPDSKDEKHFADPSKVDHSDSDDEHGNPAKIIHVENDLRERIARIFSRWMPERDEDFAGRTARRNQDFPNRKIQPKCHENVVCYFLPPEERTVTSWQWFMPDVTGGDFMAASVALRLRTLPGNEAKNPYFNASLDTLTRIFPKLNLPILTKFEISQPVP